MKYRHVALHVYLLVINNVWTLLNIYIVGSNSVKVWQGEIVMSAHRGCWLSRQRGWFWDVCLVGWQVWGCVQISEPPQNRLLVDMLQHDLLLISTVRAAFPPHYFLII